METITGKVALVTGAGSGVGRAFAIGLAEAGATVVLVGRRADKLRETKERIGERAVVLPADLTDESQVERLASEVEERFGRLDILINNAGGVVASGQVAEMTSEGFQKMMALNLTTQFLSTKYFLPLLKRSKAAKLISVTSGLAHFHMPDMGIYSASKAAVEALMKTVAVEEPEIQVNLFDPINAISEGNPNGAHDPATFLPTLLRLVTASGIIEQGRIVKPTEVQ